MSTSSVGGPQRNSISSVDAQRGSESAGSVSSEKFKFGNSSVEVVNDSSKTSIFEAVRNSISGSISNFFSGVYNFFAGGGSKSSEGFAKLREEATTAGVNLKKELKDAEVSEDIAAHVEVAFLKADVATQINGRVQAIFKQHPDSEELQKLSRDANIAAEETQKDAKQAKQAAINGNNKLVEEKAKSASQIADESGNILAKAETAVQVIHDRAKARQQEAEEAGKEFFGSSDIASERAGQASLAAEKGITSKGQSREKMEALAIQEQQKKVDAAQEELKALTKVISKSGTTKGSKPEIQRAEKALEAAQAKLAKLQTK